MEGLSGAVESSEVSWLRWPTMVVVEVEHLCFLDDSTIWCIFLQILIGGICRELKMMKLALCFKEFG